MALAFPCRRAGAAFLFSAGLAALAMAAEVAPPAQSIEELSTCARAFMALCRLVRTHHIPITNRWQEADVLEIAVIGRHVRSGTLAARRNFGNFRFGPAVSGWSGDSQPAPAHVTK